MSLLVIQQILGLFIHTLTSDGKYSLLNSDNLTQPVKMQIFKEEKKFSFFSSVLEI